jgi:hypothetical protein
MEFRPLKLSSENSRVHRDSNSQSWTPLGVWGFTPPHSLALPGACRVTPGLPLGSQHQGDDECVKHFWSGCVVSHVWWLWGSWNDECAMCFILRKKYLLHYGGFGDFGNKGILDNIIDYIHQSYPESLSSFWEESWEVVELVFVGFLLLGMSYHSHEATYWLLERKSRVKLIPCGPQN